MTTAEPTPTTAKVAGTTAPKWLVWSSIALVATLAHTLIDMHIGLWGESSDEMNAIQAINSLGQGAVYGWWILAVAFALQGDRWAMRSVLLFAAVNAFLFHGLIAIVAAPPPSAAFPFQDIAHVSSLLTGAAAAILIRRRLSEMQPGGRKYLFIGAGALILLAQVLSGLTFAQAR
jgi:hypothetical protein